MAALGRAQLARIVPSLNDPFRTWPPAFAAIPLTIAIVSLVLCMRAGRPRTQDDGWNGAAMVAAFVSIFAAMVWTVILLAQITPAG